MIFRTSLFFKNVPLSNIWSAKETRPTILIIITTTLEPKDFICISSARIIYFFLQTSRFLHGSAMNFTTIESFPIAFKCL